jgi:hypothetical protein
MHRLGGRIGAVAALVAVVALLYATPALGQGASDGEIRAALRDDARVASRQLSKVGIAKLRRTGRFTIRVHPVAAGLLTTRIRGKGFTVALGRRFCRRAGTYRVTLRVTRAGRRYLAATRPARLQLRLNFARR